MAINPQTWLNVAANNPGLVASIGLKSIKSFNDRILGVVTGAKAATSGIAKSFVLSTIGVSRSEIEGREGRCIFLTQVQVRTD